MKKRSLFAVSLASMALLVSGCLATNVVLNFNPNPLVFTPGDDTVSGQISVKFTGVGTVTVNDIVVTLLDNDGNTIAHPESGEEQTFRIDVNKTALAFGFQVSESFDVPLTYDQAKAANLSAIKIAVNGSRSTTLRIDIAFAAE